MYLECNVNSVWQMRPCKLQYDYEQRQRVASNRMCHRHRLHLPQYIKHIPTIDWPKSDSYLLNRVRETIPSSTYSVNVLFSSWADYCVVIGLFVFVIFKSKPWPAGQLSCQRLTYFHAKSTWHKNLPECGITLVLVLVLGIMTSLHMLSNRVLWCYHGLLFV